MNIYVDLAAVSMLIVVGLLGLYAFAVSEAVTLLRERKAQQTGEEPALSSEDAKMKFFQELIRDFAAGLFPVGCKFYHENGELSLGGEMLATIMLNKLQAGEAAISPCKGCAYLRECESEGISKPSQETTCLDGNVSIKGLNKADVLAALFNRAQPQGMGFMQYDPKPMTREIAEKLLSQITNFDYLQGRVMKVDLSSDTEFGPWAYDRDNGQGAAAEVIEALRKTGETNPVSVQTAHHVNTVAAAEEVKANLGKKSRWEGSTFHLGLDDMADKLGPRVDESLKRQRG